MKLRIKKLEKATVVKNGFLGMRVETEIRREG